MRDAAVIALGVGAVALMTVASFWIQGRLDRRRKAANAALAAEFERRLRSPELGAIEQHLGRPLPQSLHALYTDQTLVLADDVLIGVPNPIADDPECYVAWFEPGDLQHWLARRWPGFEGLFPVANDGAGNEFLIDPRDPDPEVIYHLHETGEKGGIGTRLSTFLAAPRRPVPDE